MASPQQLTWVGSGEYVERGVRNAQREMSNRSYKRARNCLRCRNSLVELAEAKERPCSLQYVYPCGHILCQHCYSAAAPFAEAPGLDDDDGGGNNDNCSDNCSDNCGDSSSSSVSTGNDNHCSSGSSNSSNSSTGGGGVVRTRGLFKLACERQGRSCGRCVAERLLRRYTEEVRASGLPGTTWAYACLGTGMDALHGWIVGEPLTLEDIGASPDEPLLLSTSSINSNSIGISNGNNNNGGGGDGGGGEPLRELAAYAVGKLAEMASALTGLRAEQGWKPELLMQGIVFRRAWFMEVDLGAVDEDLLLMACQYDDNDWMAGMPPMTDGAETQHNPKEYSTIRQTIEQDAEPQHRATDRSTTRHHTTSPQAKMPLIMNADVDKLNGLAPRACELCHRRSDDVMRCAACQAVYYCGRECQAADRPDHKTPCKIIKKARAHYDAEYVKLRDMPGDFLTPDKMFENEFVDALLLSYGTAGGPVDVVATCLDHLLDMMRLSRSDGMGVRQVIPSLYVRLGRDQEAYDFVKWHVLAAQDADYDWGDASQPFLDTRGADVFEDVWPSWRSVGGGGGARRFRPWLPLSHAVAVTLIKVRVLLDLRAIQNARMALRGAVPAEIVDLIRGQLVGSVVGGGGDGDGDGDGGGRRSDVLLADPEETARLAERVRGQIRELYAAVDAYNPDMWPILVDNPDAGVLERPAGPYGQHTRDEALLMVGYNYAAWYETPGAIDVLRSLAKEQKAKEKTPPPK
ncbi:MYND finger [Purpureocillium lavendulum]|uniref:MYND finger n=1 Tax=Purpureocillium lavendulum TaxID=1247861 RepID=A0AB34FGI4_9HYPO|nr:MYND finger [Purpureocillium lavendulum]